MKFYHLSLIFGLPFFLSACGQNQSGSNASTIPSPTDPGPAEEAYCQNSTSYSSPITISGTATYQAREIFGNASAGGLGAPGSARPIRYAEVSVKDSSGNTVQCAETLVDGTFSFTLPNSGQTYTVSINTRANNNNRLKASVLNAPNLNTHYSLTATFTGDGTKSIGILNASATGEVLGGAFNILDQLLNANEYLRAQAGTCSTYAGCPNFVVAPKVTAYWQMGFNPGLYLGGSGALSYYIPGYSRLFILGGKNGDVDNTDTDHFDNSVIIHEYGHFLEDQVFKSNSPGGTHNGNKIIDPRLAWSEGWGNFLQAAVLNSPYYVDSIGNSSGTTDFLFYLNLETAENDIPAELGEGNFREFSVTRLLWDAIDNTPAEMVNSATDNVSGAFKDIWAALTKSTNGFNSTSLAFRNIGDFHIFQIALGGANNFAPLLTIENQQPDKRDYARPVTTGSSCAAFSLTPASVSGDTGSFATSDLFRNNDFYHLRLNSTTSGNLVLSYSDANGVGQEADADLYLYNQSARYGVLADMVGRAENDPTGGSSTSETETVSLSGLAAGDYLINVKVYTGGGTLGGAFNYTLSLNGSQLCP